MAKGQKKKLGARKAELLDPGKVLEGKDMWRAANAMARIELRPSLKAYSRQRQRYKRDEKRDVRGLKNLSRRTDKQIRNLYRTGDQEMARQQAEIAGIGNTLKSDVANTASGISNEQVALQSSVLGGQINSLANQMIQPGYSASQNALAQSAAAAQGRRQDTAAAWGNLAATQAGGANTLASMQRQSFANQGKARRSDARYAIASRIAQTKADYGEARREVTGKMADTKALFGPTRLKNILELRGSERSFANERAAILADARAATADRKLAWAELNEDIRSNKAGEANDRRGDGGGDGGGDRELWDRPNKLGPNEWKLIKNAAANYIGGQEVKNWRGVAEELADRTGASETEIRKAIQKLKEIYG